MMKSLARPILGCAHVRLAWPGVIVECALVPANIYDTEAAEELMQGLRGFALADRNKRQKQPYPRFLSHLRYRIETVFGQLVERFHAKRVWACDLWHLTSRRMRKFLSHVLAVFFCTQNNLRI